MSALARVPVFRKDLKVLLRPLLWFVLLQVLYVPVIMLVFFGREVALPGLPEVLRVTGWMFGQLFALVAAAHFLAEERGGGTAVFLRRLPATRARIYGEKALAGLAALAALWMLEWAIQGGASAVVGRLGAEVPPQMSMSRNLGTLVAVSATSYAAGIPFSLMARQAIVVVLAGCAAWWTGFGVFLAARSPVLVSNLGWGWLAVLVLPILAAILVLGALPGRGLRVIPMPSWPQRRRFWGLLWKGLAENGALIALSVVFLAAAWAAPPSLEALWIQAGSIILITAAGAAAYAPAEMQGLHSILYQHPVPRGHLFWSKAAAAVVPVLALSAAMALRWDFPGPPQILLLLAFVTYGYACAVLLSLSIERQSTAALGAQCVVITSAVLPLGLTELFGATTDWEARMEALARASTPGFVVLAVGCFVAAWRLAGSRTFLTGSIRRRSAWAGGVLSLLMVVAVLVGSLSAPRHKYVAVS